MEPPSSNRIVILNESGRRAPRSLLTRAACAALQKHGRKNSEIAVLLTGDDHLRDLNRRFRKVDEPTDVLSFPADLPAGAPGHLGDIAISVPYADRQARARQVSLSQELGYLAIHGTLHLLGFDDHSKKDREKMVREMNEVAVQAGLKPDEGWASILHETGGRP